jgi:hypothetical protein
LRVSRPGSSWLSRLRTWSDDLGDLGSNVPLHENSCVSGSMPELVFEVVQEGGGGYCAECLTENIFTEGDTWEQLREKRA